MNVESISDDAIELAQRWAAELAIASFEDEADDDQVGLVRSAGVMSLADRDALMGWVRREMERSCIAGVFADAVRESGLAGEREVLTYCVGRKLGGPFEPGTGGWHSLALTLCEAAGWPS